MRRWALQRKLWRITRPFALQFGAPASRQASTFRLRVGDPVPPQAASDGPSSAKVVEARATGS